MLKGHYSFCMYQFLIASLNLYIDPFAHGLRFTRSPTCRSEPSLPRLFCSRSPLDGQRTLRTLRATFVAGIEACESPLLRCRGAWEDHVRSCSILFGRVRSQKWAARCHRRCVCVIVCVFSVSDSIKVVKKVLFQHVST